MDYIRSLGIAGADTIRLLAQATDSELAEADWMFGTQQQLNSQSIREQIADNAKVTEHEVSKWQADIVKASEKYSKEFTEALLKEGIAAKDLVHALAEANSDATKEMQGYYDLYASYPNLVATTVIGDIANRLGFALESTVTAISDTTEKLDTNIEESISGMSETISSETEKTADEATQSGKDLGTNYVAGFASVCSKAEGKKAANNFIKGINTAFNKVKNQDLIAPLKESLTTSISTIRSEFRTKFKKAGAYLVNGFISGIDGKLSSVRDTVSEMARAALQAAQETLDIHSPSKAFYKIGDYAGEGFINGLSQFNGASYAVAESVSEDAIAGLGAGLARINDIVAGDIDVDPVIRPVIDLTDVNTKAAQLNSMLSMPRTSRLGMTISATTNLQNGKTQEPISRSDIQAMIDRSTGKITESIAEALEGLTVEGNIGLEPNSTGIFNLVRNENRSFKLRTGFSGI